ncbi:MIZ zinc finger domain protein [Aspergillus ruber CBS 135680]|uniref:SP-RING-type domain-containing protein n=1 Tax=Aspergillus ruber (strain CBS 135680) TaxID=1388766 RepID=A0A017SN43_ASPRC|nr:uncharacterized protein EURHEDRAFT_448917 [Aspergillus ruber CBS 135680]EYE98019.1 hypothetical protein EURHEDRAFT_448917 [Aspergillus ruber CBS 135680]
MPPKVRPHLSNPRADHDEVESCNSTASLFLGGRRKSWMLDSNTFDLTPTHSRSNSTTSLSASTSQPHPTPPAPPPPPPPSRPHRPSSDNNATTPSSSSSEHASSAPQGIRNLSSHLPSSPSRTPSTSTPASAASSPPDNQLPAPVGPTRPSAFAPDKNGRLDSQVTVTTVLAPDSNQSCPVFPSPATRPAQIQTPQSLNSPQVRDAGLPAVGLPVAGTSTALNTVAVSPQHDRAYSFPMTLTTPAPQQIAGPNSTDVQSDNAFWAQSHQSLDMFINDYSKTVGLSDSVELPRVRLLRDACNSRDLLYLALHQAYCLSTWAPSQLSSLPEYSGSAILGLKVVEQLLVENQRLSSGFLEWCSLFPRDPELMTTSPQYRAASQQVARCLVSLHENWQTYDTQVRARAYPPLIDELVVRFGVTSSVMLSIVFLAMCRRVYGGRHEAQLKDLWLRNKQNYNHRFQTAQQITPEQMRLENEQLIKAYLALHTAHVNSPLVVTPAVGSPQVNSPQLVTAPHSFSSHARRQSMPSQPPTPSLPAASQKHSQPASPATISLSESRGSVARPVTVQTGPKHHVNQNSHIPTTVSNLPTQFTTNAHARVPSTANTPNLTRARAENGSNRQPRQLGPTTPAFRGSVAARPQQTRTPVAQTTLLPQPGWIPVNTVRPNSLRVGLHQAHLRDPMLKMIHQTPTGEKETELFQYLRAFMVPPTPLGLVECGFHWNFVLGPAHCQKMARSIFCGTGERSLRVLVEGCQTYRLRCIKVPPSALKLTGHDWSIAETVWPSVFYIFVNDVELYVRRKVHNGKDMPLDITDYLREGINRVSIHLIRSPAEAKDVYYVAGVEVLDIAEYATVKSSARELPASESRARIQQRLSALAADDELSIVNDDLTVNLVDPFMARIFNTPVRGSTCAHQECFDLDTFLMTRASKSGKGPMKENWKCPICGEDARPTSLIIDGFLAEVLAELKRTNRVDDARAIHIKADGSWELKTDRESQAAEDRIGSRADSANEVSAKRKHDNVTSAAPFPQRLKTEVSSAPSTGAARSPQSAPQVIELD